MLKQVLCEARLPGVSSFLRLGYVNKFFSTVKDDNTKPPSEDVEESSEPMNLEKPANEEELKNLLDSAATFSDANDKSWATSPYPKEVQIPDDLQEKPRKPQKNPAGTSILLFPGQGILKVGAVQKYLHFPNTKEIFEIASEILNYNLLELCLKGPQEKLDQTRYNQPATVVTCLAALEKIREEMPSVFENCACTAGYSVGELAALIFSGAVSIEDGIRLVAVRASAMQYAASLAPQGMMAVTCKPDSKLSVGCEEARKWALDAGVAKPVCSVAIYLYTESKILAGNLEALEYLRKNREKFNLQGLKRLPVSGAFHTRLMEPALTSFKKMLQTIEVKAPACQVIANCNFRPYRAQNLKKYLVKQIIAPVKWEQSIHAIYSRPPDTPFPKTIDVASNGKMKAILRMINLKAAAECHVI